MCSSDLLVGKAVLLALLGWQLRHSPHSAVDPQQAARHLLASAAAASGAAS